MNLGNRSGGASRLLVVATACLVALLAAGVLAVRYVVVEVPGDAGERAYDAAKQVAKDFRDAFQFTPTVRVAGRTVVERDTTVMRLVTVERTTTERHQWEHTWLGSRKVFDIEGEFVVLAGFDLEKPFSVELDEDGSIVAVDLPEPEIIAVELRDFRILRDESGLWNRLTATDREAAVAELTAVVAANAREAGVAERARQLAEERINQTVRDRSAGVTFRYAEPLP